MKRLIIALLIASTFLTGCGLKTDKKEKSNENTTIAESSNKDLTKEDKNNNDSNNNYENKYEESKIEENELVLSENISFEEVKNYILNGQGDIPSALKLKWSERFLNEINFDKLYSDYIDAGNPKDDINGLAEYITSNSTEPSNWEELFKADLLDTYGENLSKLEKIGKNTETLDSYV